MESGSPGQYLGNTRLEFSLNSVIGRHFLGAICKNKEEKKKDTKYSKSLHPFMSDAS